MQAQEDASLLLHNFYKVKNPEKLDSIPIILERYQGREGLLYANLMEKYNITTEQIVAEFPELEKFVKNLLKAKYLKEKVKSVKDVKVV